MSSYPSITKQIARHQLRPGDRPGGAACARRLRQMARARLKAARKACGQNPAIVEVEEDGAMILDFSQPVRAEK